MESSSPLPKTKYQEKILTLPKLKLSNGVEIFFHHPFWCVPLYLEGILEAQDHFSPQPDDIFLCTFPKSGTTWIKALAAAILTRERLDYPSNPLLNKLPHAIVPFLEVDIYPQPSSFVRDPEIPVIATHIPYQALPKPILDSGNKLIYLCRNPKDVFCSSWHFQTKWTGVKEDDTVLEELFESFCKGEFYAGPFWVSILGYWKASQEFPEKVLFLKYEDLKDEPVREVKKMAEFMGRPITEEEEGKGVVEKIVEMCSFENLSNLEVNIKGKLNFKGVVMMENRSFFRKGEKGDWRNLLRPEMAEKLDRITEEKLRGSGLSLN